MESLKCLPGPDGRCAICSDEGEIGRVVELLSDVVALVELPAGPAEVATDLVPGVRIDDVLVVHLGFAIARLDQAGVG